MEQRDWLGSWEIGVKNEEVRRRSWRSRGLKNGDGVRSRDRKRRVRGNGGDDGWKRNASIGNLVEIGKDMIAKARRG